MKQIDKSSGQLGVAGADNVVQHAAPNADKSSARSNQPAKKAPGLLGQWLGRKEPQQTVTESLKVRTGPTADSADPDTPTWSASSEASDFASVEAHSSPAAVTATAQEQQPQAPTMGQQAQARLAGRFGGWLTGVTSAAGTMLGGAVRGGSKAIQRLTAQERLQDLHAASQHLEATASGLHGEARLRTLQRWCCLLDELQPSKLPLLHGHALHALAPASPLRSSFDGDWQQLQISRSDTPAASPAAAASQKPSMHSAAQPDVASSQASPGAASRAGLAAKGPELDFWANQVLYVDQQSVDKDKGLFTFRELFLRSYALENIIVGYIDSPATSSEERHVLYKLFGLCLSGNAALHTSLVDALLDLSAVEDECRGVGTAATLGQEQPSLANVVAEAICGIKIQAECEVLDRRMAGLKADMGEQAAEVHRSHKFNSGANEPTGDSSPAKLASGLLGTAEVMQLGSKFQEYSVQRASQAGSRAKPQYEAYLHVAQQHAKALDAAVAELESKADATHKQKADGEAFRERKLADEEDAVHVVDGEVALLGIAHQREYLRNERKLAEMEDAVHVVDGEIAGLEEQQAELLRQLQLVQDQISAAKARKSDMEEGRHVFQEGNAFTLEALQHKVDELSRQHQHHLAENAALAECQTLLQEAAKGWEATSAAAEAASAAGLRQAGQEYMHAATRHLYYQRALLQLLLRQLTFCVSELQSLAEKEGSLERMGMDGIISDMRAGKQRLQAKHLEAHASALHHFADVAAVETAVKAACGGSPALPPQPTHAADQGQSATPQDPTRENPAAVEQTQPGQQGTATQLGSSASDTVLHPLAVEEGTSKADKGPNPRLDWRPDSSRDDEAGLSEELLDLFASIDYIRQEVEALQQPVKMPDFHTLEHTAEQAPVGHEQQQHQHRHQQSSPSTQPIFSDHGSDVDMQLAELQISAEQASQLALGSASDMVARSHRLSDVHQKAASPGEQNLGADAAEMYDTLQHQNLQAAGTPP